MKNKLSWGIHRGTIMSRDVGDPKPCHSLDEAKKMAIVIDEESRQTGYMLWFASWYDENGKTHEAHPGNSYS